MSCASLLCSVCLIVFMTVVCASHELGFGVREEKATMETQWDNALAGLGGVALSRKFPMSPWLTPLSGSAGSLHMLWGLIVFGYAWPNEGTHPGESCR